ncbi:MAG: glycosyltransferase family 9 protein [Kiritimatiellae bacterium]|nr:glycosyltransferase family 9 protein [Kiritimatiellia bacterium]
MRILVIKLSSIGDLFCALPTVHNLKVELDAEIDWVTQKEYVDLVNCFTDVDNVIPYYRHSFLASMRPFLKRLREREYDYVVDMQGLLKSAFAARMARAKKRIGPSFHREGSRLFYNAIAGPRNKNRHSVDEILDVVSYLGLKRIVPEFHLKFPDKHLPQTQPSVAMIPVSRWETKNWPIKHYIETGKRLKADGVSSIFLLGGPDDVAVCSEIERAIGDGVVNMAGKSTLVEAGSILQQMNLVISNDSGLMHMSVALGIPTIVIHGATDPMRTGPYGAGNSVLKTNLPCQPCLSRVCTQGAIPCLSGVSPEEVVKTAHKLMQA